MELREILRAINGSALFATDDMMNRDYSYCVASDMMSNVMLDIVDDSILITGLVNPQVIRASEMMNISCIIITCGRTVTDRMIKLAETRDIALAVTDQTTFTVCGKLHTMGMTEGPVLDTANIERSLEFYRERCNGCIKCVRACPTEAIRVRDGKAERSVERCIDCGKCITACPRHAIRPKVDKFDIMDNFDRKVAIVSSALYGQFPGVKSRNHLLTAIKKVGFDDVIEEAVGSEMVSHMVKEVVESGERPYPIISGGCHAVVNLIQIRFPNLLEHLIEYRQPSELAARKARKEALAKYPDKTTGIFLIAPCTAKISSVKDIGTKADTEIDGMFAIHDLYRAILENLNNLQDEDVEDLERAGVNGLRWANTGGEALAIGTDKFIAIDGVDEVIDIFERLEDDKLQDLEFIEAGACIGGCLGGCLNMENIYSAKANVKLIVDEAKEKYGFETLNVHEEESRLIRKEQLRYRPVMQLDDDLNVALKKMEELGKIARRLPGIDCGACGAPTCRAFAEDVVRGMATGEECLLASRHGKHRWR